MKRIAEINRKTKETDIFLKLNLDGSGKHEISTQIPFFDHMLSLFAVHGFFDLNIAAKGDVEVDFHHTVEDIGLVLGEAVDNALTERKGIKRYGHTVLPMDDALSSVTVDMSKRPFLAYNVSCSPWQQGDFDILLAKEFFRAFANKGGMNLHINLLYGENMHHILESIFKATGLAIDHAVSFDKRVSGIHSSKGVL